MVSRHPVDVGEPSVLRGGDFAEISRLRSCYDGGGPHAFNAALHALCERDVNCYIRVMRAILPDQIRHALLDEAEGRGLSGELDRLLQHLQSANSGT